MKVFLCVCVFMGSVLMLACDPQTARAPRVPPAPDEPSRRVERGSPSRQEREPEARGHEAATSTETPVSNPTATASTETPDSVPTITSHPQQPSPPSISDADLKAISYDYDAFYGHKPTANTPSEKPIVPSFPSNSGLNSMTQVNGSEPIPNQGPATKPVETEVFKLMYAGKTPHSREGAIEKCMTRIQSNPELTQIFRQGRAVCSPEHTALGWYYNIYSSSLPLTDQSGNAVASMRVHETRTKNIHGVTKHKTAEEAAKSCPGHRIGEDSWGNWYCNLLDDRLITIYDVNDKEALKGVPRELPQESRLTPQTSGSLVNMLYLPEASEGSSQHVTKTFPQNWEKHGLSDDVIKIPNSTERVYTVSLPFEDAVLHVDGAIAAREQGGNAGVENEHILPGGLFPHLDLLSGHFQHQWTQDAQGAKRQMIWAPSSMGKIPGTHKDINIWRRVWDKAWGAALYRFEAQIRQRRGESGSFEDLVKKSKDSWENCVHPKIDCPDRLTLTDDEKRHTMAIGVDGSDLLEFTWWDHDFRDIFQNYYGIPRTQVITVGSGASTHELANQIEEHRSKFGDNGYVFLSGMSSGGPVAAATAMELDRRQNARRNLANQPTSTNSNCRLGSSCQSTQMGGNHE